jgi:ferric-dicitrate binding protein FerR (iron transport regulator)
MNKHDFIKLLNKYLEGSATAEERSFVINYYNVFENEQDVLDLLSDESRDELKTGMNAKIWETIGDREKHDMKIRVLKKWSFQLAVAAVVLAIGISSVIFYQNRTSTKPVVSKVVLSGKDNQAVSLPDGSMVILCVGSELDYPVSFNDQSEREVTLKGQAYFDIHHDESKPFIVHTGKIKTTVLGTAFNIKAFEKEQDITVTVQRGRVKVNNEDKELCVITPSQQVVYNKQTDGYVQNVVTNDDYLSWKAYDLYFDNLTVTEAADLLERRYDVKISVNNPSRQEKRFTATFLKNQSLEKCLNGICAFNNCVYTYDKQKATVSIVMK